jgi:hypothetical protein
MLPTQSYPAPSGGAQQTFEQRCVANPHWLPHSYDPQADTLTFIHAPRDDQRRAVFLDGRFAAAMQQSQPVPISTLSRREIKAKAGQLHFIFHTAFCCSTLLARALDIPGVSMGLKEPAVFLPFAKMWTSARQRPGAFDALEIVLDLLSRPLSPGEVQIAKPSNAANHIIPYLLHTRTDARALVMTSSLESFLSAVVRRGAEGRQSMRGVLAGFTETIPFDPPLGESETLLLTDLQAASLAWLMQTAFLESVAKRFGTRVRVLDADTLLAQPAQSLAATGKFFGLKDADWEKIANGPVFNEHAKNLGAPFNAAARTQQRQDATFNYRSEIEPAIAWTKTVAQRFNVPSSLTETLL